MPAEAVMKRTLRDYLDTGLEKFGSKKELALRCGIAESQLYAMFAGERPGVLVALRLARGLGADPVELLMASGQGEDAGLLSHFLPEGKSPPEPVDGRVEALLRKVRELASHGLLESLEQVVAAVEGPWRRCRDGFREVVASSRAEAGFLAVRRRGQWHVVFSESCGPDQVKAALARSKGWRFYSHEKKRLKMRLYLHDANRPAREQIDFYLRLSAAMIADVIA